MTLLVTDPAAVPPWVPTQGASHSMAEVAQAFNTILDYFQAHGQRFQLIVDDRIVLVNPADLKVTT